MRPRQPRFLVHVSSAMDTTIKNRVAIIEDSGEIIKRCMC